MNHWVALDDTGVRHVGYSESFCDGRPLQGSGRWIVSTRVVCEMVSCAECLSVMAAVSLGDRGALHALGFLTTE